LDVINCSANIFATASPAGICRGFATNLPFRGLHTNTVQARFFLMRYPWLSALFVANQSRYQQIVLNNRQKGSQRKRLKSGKYLERDLPFL